jgi:hypothetical protein
MRVSLVRSLSVIGIILCFSACDILLDDPPEKGSERIVQDPYGVGKGKVVFFSDLMDAEGITVSVADEEIGSISEFTECIGDIAATSGQASAVRPAGTYRYSAESRHGLSWSGTVTVSRDEVSKAFLTGRPRDYSRRAPAAFQGLEVRFASEDQFHANWAGTGIADVIIRAPSVVEGDRFTIVLNGEVIAEDVIQSTSDVSIEVELKPGPNWIIARISHDAGFSGTNSDIVVRPRGTTGSMTLPRPVVGDWRGRNFRHNC